MRILIAEDEERARRGLRSVLTSLSEDYEVVAEASNGKQALELLQILKPDVVFTDLKMPFLDGMGLIKAGKTESNGCNPYTQIIMGCCPFKQVDFMKHCLREKIAHHIC